MQRKITSVKINITNELLLSLQKEQLNFLPWQNRWYQTRFLKNRSLKKGRQIGADYYFLFEALQDACLTGRNKIFMGCVQVNYLLKHAMIKEISGSNHYLFKLSNGANIYVLDSDYLDDITLGGISGDVYISELSWIPNFMDVIKLANAFSAHDKWRVTSYTFRSTMDICSLLNFSNLSEQLLGNNYYQDTIQNSEYELGKLSYPNEFLIMGRKNDRHLSETVFCCFNDN